MVGVSAGIHGSVLDEPCWRVGLNRLSDFKHCYVDFVGWCLHWCITLWKNKRALAIHDRLPIDLPFLEFGIGTFVIKAVYLCKQ